MYNEYRKFIVDLCEYEPWGLKFVPLLNEHYTQKNKNIKTEFHIHQLLDKPIILVNEGIQDLSRDKHLKFYRATLHFEMALENNGNPISPRNFDILFEFRKYDHKKIYKNGKEVAWFFQHDVKKHGLENIINELKDKEFLLNNPWKYFDISNVDFLKYTDNTMNREKITNSKIRRIPEQFREIFGHKPKIKDNQIKIQFYKKD